MNPLDNLPRVRAALYTVQFVVTGALSISGVVFLSMGTGLDALPQWYVIALAVSPPLWAYLGITAKANVPAA